MVGSANVDSVFTVASIPRPGETVLSSSRSEHPGGKGLNQAVAAARSGASTTFVGAVGEDAHGVLVREALDESGVMGLLRRASSPTGSAVVAVDQRGENAITVDPGANGTLGELGADEATAVQSAAVLLLQLESPLESVRHAASIARSAGRTVVLNAAPSGALDAGLLTLVDVLVVNEHEAVDVAALVAGPRPEPIGSVDEARVVATTLAGFVTTVVLTLGDDGAVVVGEASAGTRWWEHVAAPAVEVVDTTAAGDTFCGALAAELAAGSTLSAAVAFGVRAGSLAVQRRGAVTSIPWRAELAVGTMRAPS